VDEGEVVKAAGLVYVVPLVGLFLGFGAGQWLRSSLGLRSELWTLLCGLIAMGLSLVAVYFFDRHGKSRRCLPRMEQAN
jgi:positive regulator of sigma E activity